MDEMTDDQKVRAVVLAWQGAEPVLKADRDRRIREANPAEVIPQYAGLVTEYLKRNGHRTTSGLVDMQRIFRLHRT
jgi:hypothetical protein